MILEAKKLVCDQCGKQTEWIERNTRSALLSFCEFNDSKTDGDDWIRLNIEPERLIEHQLRDYCSSQCVKDALDKAQSNN